MVYKQKIYELEVNQDTLYIKAPWNEDLHNFIKSRHGHWVSGHNKWKINKKLTSDIDQKLYSLYGSNYYVSVELCIETCKVNGLLEIFGQKIIEINQFNSIYVVHSSVKSMTKRKKWFLSNIWTQTSNSNFYTKDFNSYFAQRIASLLDPFIIENLTLSMDNITIKQIHELKSRNYPFIKEIRIVS